MRLMRRVEYGDKKVLLKEHHNIGHVTVDCEYVVQCFRRLWKDFRSLSNGVAH